MPRTWTAPATTPEPLYLDEHAIAERAATCIDRARLIADLMLDFAISPEVARSLCEAWNVSGSEFDRLRGRALYLIREAGEPARLRRHLLCSSLPAVVNQWLARSPRILDPVVAVADEVDPYGDLVSRRAGAPVSLWSARHLSALVGDEMPIARASCLSLLTITFAHGGTTSMYVNRCENGRVIVDERPGAPPRRHLVIAVRAGRGYVFKTPP